MLMLPPPEAPGQLPWLPVRALQRPQGDKPRSDPFWLPTPVRRELPFSAPTPALAKLGWQRPRKPQLQHGAEGAVVLTWGSRGETSTGTGWVLGQHGSGVASHPRGASEFAGLFLLFGRSGWLSFADATEESSVTRSGLLFL